MWVCVSVCVCVCLCAKLRLKVFSLLSLGAENLFELGMAATTDNRFSKKQVLSTNVPVGIGALNLALKVSSNYSLLSSYLASCLSRNSEINGEHNQTYFGTRACSKQNCAYDLINGRLPAEIRTKENNSRSFILKF